MLTGKIPVGLRPALLGALAFNCTAPGVPTKPTISFQPPPKMIANAVLKSKTAITHEFTLKHIATFIPKFDMPVLFELAL